MVDETFSSWLQSQMKAKDLTQSELARLGNVSRAAINKLVLGERGPGPELCNAIAKALGVAPTTVFQKAGLLPPTLPETVTVEDIKAIMANLDEDEKQDVLEYARLRLRLAEEKLAKKREQEEAAAAAARKKSGQFSISG